LHLLQTWNGYYTEYSAAAFDAIQRISGAEKLIKIQTEPMGTKKSKTKKTPLKKTIPLLPPPTLKASPAFLPPPPTGKATAIKSGNTNPQLPLITLKPILIKKSERLLFTGNYPKKLNNQILKKIPGAKYCMHSKAWHVPMNKEVYSIIKQKTTNIAFLQTDAWRNYLKRRNIIEKSTPVPVTPHITAKRTFSSTPIATENLKQIERLIQQLILEKLSVNTIKSYRTEFIQFAKWLGEKPVKAVNMEDIKNFMLYSLTEEQITENTAHSRINALKAYYEKVLKRKKIIFDIPRPKKHSSLPEILSEQEIGRLFNGLANVKHKSILFTAYSSGLRVDETCSLRLKDIDRDRMQLSIYKGKGKKNGIVPLSPLVSDILLKYLEKEKTKPLKYLFEGNNPGKPISRSSAQKSFHKAKEGSEILKSVGFHSLRHSFATHILEKGVTTRYIKVILGNYDIKTTEQYLHVAKTSLVNVADPIDELW